MIRESREALKEVIEGKAREELSCYNHEKRTHFIILDVKLFLRILHTTQNIKHRLF